MTEKIEKALWQDYEDIDNLIGDLDIEDHEKAYVNAQETKDKIRNEIIKIEQLKQEREIREKENKTESRKNLFHIIETGIVLGINTATMIWTIAKTFKFDETATITSTMGRGTLNSVIPKLFKR